MEILQSDYEKLGAFYLGREYDLKQGELQDQLVMYDSKDLVTHGVVLGMTGSGKTGLCISLLEEAAMDNIPAIVIDPKGDIANLMLAFPEMQGSDFHPWINEDDAVKKGLSGEEYAKKTAKMWKEGIESWGQGCDRVKAFKENVDVNIFTPGSKAGIPVSILSSLDAPPFEVMDDSELLGDRIESTVSSLLSLLGVDADPIQSHEAVLLSTIFNHAWNAGKGLTIESLIGAIMNPDFDKVGVIDLESYYPSKKRQELALKFNNLLASPGFSTWMEGPSLDIQKMLYQDNGKARISIFSIAHLSDSERMFFVSILLNQMLGWMRTQSGTTSLRALLYMDEIYGYLPPTANPPSKKPMMTMLKQGRAFGLGVLLATQNPVDLDYKALSNIGTWWLGRLQTERDKMRVLDGLEGAAASQDGSFDRQEMEELLAGLGSRVFLMNNVHEDGPVVFHVRWVMSYLRGPLTRRQIKTLMDPKRDAWIQQEIPHKAAPNANPMAMPESQQGSVSAGAVRPVVGQGVDEYFTEAVRGQHYTPHLLRQATVHFSNEKRGVDGARVVRFVNRIKEDGIDWDHDIVIKESLDALQEDPSDGVDFAELPGFAMNANNYKGVEEDFEEWIYRNERVELLYCSLTDEYSKMGEAEGQFRARLAHAAREARDEAISKIREKIQNKIQTKRMQLDRAESSLERERSQAKNARVRSIGGYIASAIGVLFQRKSGSAIAREISTNISKEGNARQQERDVEVAQDRVREVENAIAELEEDLREEIQELEQKFDPAALKLEKDVVKPYKKDIRIDSVGLLWIGM